MGTVYDEERTGLAEHEHQVRWSVSPHEDKPNGSYISINVWLDCGCTIRDLKVFASQMRQQKGLGNRHYWRAVVPMTSVSYGPPCRASP